MAARKTKRTWMGAVTPIHGLMKIIPTKGYSSMKKILARNRRARNHSQPSLFEWAESQRRNIDRHKSAERMFRELGHSPSVARLRAAHAGFPVEGD